MPTTFVPSHSSHLSAQSLIASNKNLFRIRLLGNEEQWLGIFFCLKEKFLLNQNANKCSRASRRCILHRLLNKNKWKLSFRILRHLIANNFFCPSCLWPSCPSISQSVHVQYVQRVVIQNNRTPEPSVDYDRYYIMSWYSHMTMLWTEVQFSIRVVCGMSIIIILIIITELHSAIIQTQFCCCCGWLYSSNFRSNINSTNILTRDNIWRLKKIVLNFLSQLLL